MESKGVVYVDLLKPDETVNFYSYQNQIVELKKCLIDKRLELANRYGKVILLHDNAPAHTSKRIKSMLKDLSWEVLTYTPYSLDLAPSDFYLFRSVTHMLAEQHFKTYENVQKGSMNGSH